MEVCPTSSATSMNFKITAGNGESRAFVLNIRNLASHTVNWLAMLALLAPLLVAVYFLATMRMTETAVVDLSPLLMLIVLLLLGLLIQTARPATITSVLDFVGDVFKSSSWHILGSVLACLACILLAIQILRRGMNANWRADLVVIGAFFVLVFLLLAPVGFDSIGEWEIWPVQAYLEGRPSRVATEVVSRFWAMVPHGLASIISSDSFVGYHLLNLFMFWGKIVLFYGILRQLGVQPWLAFLAALLFLFYPVNSGLMSLRSIVMTLSKLSLLAAIFLILDCRTNSSRLHLLGIWLALMINLGTYEIGFAIILIVPALWWWGRPRQVWRNAHLTMIWYLVPVAKIAYMLLLTVNSRQYYGTWMLTESSGRVQITLDAIRHYLDVIATVYLRTFLYGWQDAVNALGQNAWIAATALTLVIIGMVVTYLTRQSSPETFPSLKETAISLLGGLLFILPSIGILMWFSQRAYDPWRMYVYVPLGAAIAMLAVVTLVATRIGSFRLRQVFIIGISLLLIFPALSRLYIQQDKFVAAANAKARILMQIVEQVPQFDETAKLAVVTSMPIEALEWHGIGELMKNMFDSAIYMLYQESRPKVASMCILGKSCSGDDISEDVRYRISSDDLSDVVMFRLHDDLRVELLRELPPELGDREIVNYDPDRLIDTSAPIPPRALSLLASARRD